jgi:hypothetical protein
LLIVCFPITFTEDENLSPLWWERFSLFQGLVPPPANPRNNTHCKAFYINKLNLFYFLAALASIGPEVAKERVRSTQERNPDPMED